MVFVFGVRDVKAESFVGNPIFARARGLAVRAFTDAVNDPTHEFGKYPQDYQLFELGEWDEQSGVLLARTGGVLELGSGLSYLTPKE